ncbi:MAG TPA: AAA family ATPase [Candidatus Nanopelagicales bacterium]|nr:AAA family ATPase [Candidatus Nanopelagicales bacterium]
MLRSLHIRDVGPAARFDLELGERLNVLTGDNGLGKSFLLEVAWWALTGTWTERPVLPQRGKEERARIEGEVGFTRKWERGQEVTPAGSAEAYGFKTRFNRLVQKWDNPVPLDRRNTWVTAVSGVDVDASMELGTPILYVRTNGACSLWDPARGQPREGSHWHRFSSADAYHFSEHELWNSLSRDGKTLCNGLIQDWITWQLEADAGAPADHPFHLLRRVLEQLSHPDEPMVPGRPVQPYLDDVRRFPTLDLPYETGVPIVNASAGMKRILGLAYLLVWAWTEHLRASRIIGWPPPSQLVVLLEEPETHLHPRWQRHIVPALLRVLTGLTPGADAGETPEMRPQLILTTHAPMVLASLEPHFDRDRDKLFSFELTDRREVVLEELPWTRYGDAVGWLTSPVFDLPEARSPEAERAIAAAYDFMASRLDRLPEGLQTGDAIHAELQRVLADQDPFWPQWLFAREKLPG